VLSFKLKWTISFWRTRVPPHLIFAILPATIPLNAAKNESSADWQSWQIPGNHMLKKNLTQRRKARQAQKLGGLCVFA
jgi:hypothetical protein